MNFDSFWFNNGDFSKLVLYAYGYNTQYERSLYLLSVCFIHATLFQTYYINDCAYVCVCVWLLDQVINSMPCQMNDDGSFFFRPPRFSTVNLIFSTVSLICTIMHKFEQCLRSIFLCSSKWIHFSSKLLKFTRNYHCYESVIFKHVKICWNVSFRAVPNNSSPSIWYCCFVENFLYCGWILCGITKINITSYLRPKQRSNHSFRFNYDKHNWVKLIQWNNCCDIWCDEMRSDVSVCVYLCTEEHYFVFLFEVTRLQSIAIYIWVSVEKESK